VTDQLPPSTELSLLDWRRRISELYVGIRADSNPSGAWRNWCDTRRQLFTSHPQSPLPPERRQVTPAYFDYDPRARVAGRVRPAELVETRLPGSGSETFAARRFATVEFDLMGEPRRLDLFWLLDYAGGLFLPFRDLTTGVETYAGGRYLLDTAKGADLGGDGESLILDFNFSYQPSCSYDPWWSCPLSPPGGALSVPVLAGERL
jgi:uncharacterized protein (DUF1684 family)